MKLFHKDGGAGPFDLPSSKAEPFKDRVAREVPFPAGMSVSFIQELDTPHHGERRVSFEPSYADYTTRKVWASEDVSIPDDTKARISRIYAEICAA